MVVSLTLFNTYQFEYIIAHCETKRLAEYKIQGRTTRLRLT